VVLGRGAGSSPWRRNGAGRGSQGPWQRHRQRAARAAGWSGTV
jgi:hypothetical protein